MTACGTGSSATIVASAGRQARGHGARGPGARAASLGGTALGLLLALGAAGTVLGTAGPVVASPVAGETDFNVPAGDLGRVLTGIGRAASQPISFPAALTRGRTAGPIVGRMGVQDAVARALAGTGLVAVPGAGGALIVQTGGGASAAGPAVGGDLAAIDVTDTRGGDQGFAAGTTVSSSRLDIPLKENPRSVVGVTREVIQAQSQTSVLNTAANVSNVRIDEGSGQGNGVFKYTIRGFEQQQILVNGQAAPIGFNVPITDVDRVDVIKGPTTELTGQTFLGGAINAIMKAPTADPIRRMDVFLGSRFYRTLAFDLGGPVPDLDGVTYRLNLSGNTANTTFGGYNDPHEALISPVVRWQGSDTSVTAGMRYIDQMSAPPPVAVTAGPLNRPLRIPRESPFGNADAYSSNRSFNPYTQIEHKFGSFDAGAFGNFDITAHNQTSYFANNLTGQQFIPVFNGIRDGVPYATAQSGAISSTRRTLVTQTDLVAVQTLDNIKNTMRFGLDYSDTYINDAVNSSFKSPIFPLATPLSNLPLLPLAPSPSNYLGFSKTIRNIIDTGVTYQQKIDLFDRLHIIGLVRNDWFDQDITATNHRRTRLNSQKMSYLSYNAGAVYDILPWVSIYGSVGTGFRAQIVPLANGQIAPPQTSDLNEVGFKFNLLDGLLKVTTARFDNAYSNYTIYNPAALAYTLGPGYRAKGYEIDFQGQLTENIQIIGGYSYTDFLNAATLGAPPGTPVNVVPAQPQQQANLFAIYTFLDGDLKGLSIGGGARGQSFSYNSPSAPKFAATKVPGFITFDAALGYTMDRVKIDLNVRNLFDRYYYNVGIAPFVPVAQGRTFTIRASLDF